MLVQALPKFIKPAEMEMLTTSMLGQKDGVCNSMPGWDPLNIWNPKGYEMDPDCRLHPMYQQRGMGAGASYGGQY